MNAVIPQLARTKKMEMSSIARRAWRVLGVVCASIGAVNAFLPVLPTTVFWIIAAWAFGKSSPELARRLREHPRFGPGLKLWLDHRMMSRRSKCAAIAAIGCSYAVTLTLMGLSAVGFLLGLGLAALSVYLGSRREPSSHAAR
jgi:uncharacterized membrane protein YbaN (DUF454 family)